MKRKDLKQLILTVATTLTWTLGCAPSVGHLERHLEANELEQAVDSAKGDPAMQVELAALILERAAAVGTRTPELIGVLAGAGRPGRRALDRLAKRADTAAGRQALIALDRASKPATGELARFIKDDDSDVRAAAAAAWNQYLAVGALEELLRDHDPRVRRSAVRGLVAHTGETEVDALLRDALRLDPDPKVRAEAARSGSALGADALLALKGTLLDRNRGVRLSAIQGLAETGDETALAIIEEMAVGPLDLSAVVAATELSRLGRRVGQERIREALSDERAQIRAAAFLRLERARFGSREEIALGLLEDAAPEVVLLSAHMLSRQNEISPKVMKALRKLVELEVSKSEEARDLLAVLGDKEAIASVAKALSESAKGEDARTVAIVGRVRKAEALEGTFVDLMASPSEGVRIAAASALLHQAR